MYRNLLLTVHIASVAAWLGANLVQFALTPWFARQGGAAAVAWFRATGLLAQRYYNVAGVVLGISGVLLVQESGFDWSAGFIAVGIGTIVVGAVLGVAFFAREGDRMAAAAEAGGRGMGLVRRALGVAAIDTSLVLITVLAMVSKWRA